MVARKREFHFLLIFALSLSTFLVSAYSKDFDYFWHVQNWQTSVCKGLDPSQGPCTAQDEFFIYGLWPEFENGTYPLYCNGPKFDSNLVDLALLYMLQQFWPPKSGNEGDFSQWREAWEKHGVCSVNALKQTEYFESAIAVMNKEVYDIPRILDKARIRPNNKKLLKKTSVKNVISAQIGKKVGIQCWKNIETGQYMLTRVILCFERDGKTVRDCPSSADKACPDSFIWPTKYYEDPILAMSTDDDH